MDVGRLTLPPSAAEGVWFELVLLAGALSAATEAELRADKEWEGAERLGSAILVSSSDVDEYQIAAQQWLKKHYAKAAQVHGRRNPQSMRLPDAEDSIEAQVRALAEVILRDWRGFEEDGAALPCTPENRLRMLREPRFRKVVTACADDQAAFEEADLGNSARSPAPASRSER